MPSPHTSARSWLLALLLAGTASADDVTLSGVTGVTLLDAGRFSVSGAASTARDETFEFLRRADGGYTLLSATTMRDGAYRVQARYDYDAAWNAVAAVGQGRYGDEPVHVELKTAPGAVAIRVRGPKTAIDRTIPCPAGCFTDLAPSGSPMFVMTRHYDRAKRGEQSFQWAAQDLARPQTSPEDQRASIELLRETTLKRAGGATLVVREYRQIERIPTPAGPFVMTFGLWTDDSERPLAYRIDTVQGKPPKVPIVAIREGYEEVRAILDAAR
jgi:hypothetical protein